MRELAPALLATGLLAAGLVSAALLAAAAAPLVRPIVIAHRGASGERPEHTLEAYRLAIEQGADFVEPDLVATRDAVLVCRHENEISGTTDVASRVEFAGRRTTRTIDGVATTGWFTEDFTLAELRTLRARERLPQLRGTAWDGRFAVPTLDEALELVAAANRAREHSGRPLGVYPEIKHPSYFASIGLALEPLLVAALRRHGLDREDAPVFVQSFEAGSLRGLAALTRVPLVQLVSAEGRPWDRAAGRHGRSYAEMIEPAGLREIAGYARGIGAQKELVLARGADGRPGAPTALVREAHRAGLLVHVWTLRAENAFLPAELRRGLLPATRGDLAGEARAFLDAGVDGFFTDHPGVGVEARDGWMGGQ